MSARKLQQEIDKEFKRVAEGIQAFDGIYDKLSQSTNQSQREKLEDALKKEIKKLQRSRDKIKGWASQNDIKDKKPLLDQRKLIETKMEMFKAVEKEMKTKAYSKEGLSAATKLDPKEKEKAEMCTFLADTVDELGRQIEAFEAESETLHAGAKKSKKDNSKAERVAELDRTTEQHKWHVSKLELLLRSLENGGVETEQVKEIEDGIRYYVEQNQEVDFVEDDTLYDDLNLEEDEELWGMGDKDDKISSQDTQSIHDEPPDLEPASTTNRANSMGTSKGKSGTAADTQGSGRRSSTQLKTPLPLATLQSSLPSTSSKAKDLDGMKPAPMPTIPTGQTLKYASAAAAAAASDRNGVGIAPLPPPPGASRSSETSSPAAASVQPATVTPSPSQSVSTPAKVAEDLSQKQSAPAVKEELHPEPAPSDTTRSKTPSIKPSPRMTQAQPTQSAAASSSKAPQPPSPDSGVAGIALSNGEPAHEEDEEESIYHLPSSLTDLLGSFEETRERSRSNAPIDVELFSAARLNCPIPLDAEKPHHYRPLNPYTYTPAHYPQEPLGIFDDPRLYGRIDNDSLFYAFYYRQGTYQQYLAAKALKQQSWRFHKQYQTWFQRHEEPKNITEEYEQGMYRFFDYESTWMNRRKLDFKFAYKFLEDDL